MTIEENLALAYLRASPHPSPFSRISRKADRELFPDKLLQLDMGLEDRMKQPVGLLSGGQRQALTLLMATWLPPSCCCWTSTPPPWTPPPPIRCWS